MFDSLLDALGYVGGGKVCPRCKVWKPREGFHKTRSKKDGLQSHCKGCGTASNGRWSAANPGRRREISRKSHLKRMYGMAPAAYEAMYSTQKGCCCICGEHHPRLCVDHDHATGRVRALLCDPCNHGVGSFRDRPDVIRKAAEYVEQHKGAG